MLKPDIRSLQTGDARMWDVGFHWLWPVACAAANRRLATFAPAEVEDVAVGAIREAAEQVQAGKVESFEDLKALTGVIASRRALDLIRRMQAERRASGMTQTMEAREAEAAERAELQALIAENPKLKEEFEQLGAESAAVREILPLLEDIEHPQGRIPPPPMARLQKAVREVFEPRKESAGELRELLARLEQWASRLVGTERARLKELIAGLRESLSAQGGAPEAGEMATLRSRRVRYAAAPVLQEEVMACALPEERDETKSEEAELENRLRALEARIRRAEEITHECRDEVRGLLEAFARSREAKAERRGKHPKSTSQEQE
jgi:hypothetical protein